MEKILNQILSTSSTVILPHFGAILKIGTGYQFNEFLKYNDGKLIAAVEETKKLSKDDATEFVSDYIRSIKEHLNADKDFKIESIGEISKKSGKITLNSFEVISSTEEVKPISKPVIKKSKPIEIKKSEPVKEKKEEVKEAPKQPEVKAEKIIEKEELPKAYTSTNLVVDRAIEKILTFKNLEELIAFGNGETREKVLTAIHNKKESLSNPKVVPTATVTKSEEPKTETIKEVQKTPVPAEKEIEEKTKSSAPKKEEIKPIPVVVPKPEVKEQAAKVTPVSPVSNKEDEKIENELIAGAIVIEKEAKKRKRNRFILWVAILLLLIGTSIMGFLKKNEILALINKTEIAENKNLIEEEAKDKHAKTNEHKDEHTPEVNSHSEIAVEEATEPIEVETEEASEPIAEVIVEEEVIEPKIEKEVKSTNNKGKYNIIVGSFSSEDNANKLVSKLNSDGFNNAKMIGKYGSLYTVSADNFESRDDASSALSNIKDKGYSGWIKKI